MKYVIQCDDVYGESARVANKICALVGGSARYRDIVVAMCDFERTLPIFNETFAQYGIPTNVDVGKSLMDFCEIKRLRDVLQGAPWVEKVNFPHKSVTGICSVLRSLTTTCVTEKRGGVGGNAPLGEPLDEWREGLEKVLSTIEKIMGNETIPMVEFCNMFCTLCTATKISSVPKFGDRVMLVDVNEFEPARTPYLFITGASDGAFPQSVPDTDILTEQDISAMSIKIEPSATLQSRRAYRHAQNIINCASRDVFMSFCATNAGGERVGVTNLARGFTPDTNVEPYSREFARTIARTNDIRDIEHATYIATLVSAIGDKTPKPTASPDTFNFGNELFFGKGHVGVTALENFAKCPYSCFLTYGLGLKKRDPIGIVPANVVGTIFHNFVFLLTSCAPNDRGRAKIKSLINQVLKDYKFNRVMTRVITKQCELIAKNLGDIKPKLLEHNVEKQIAGVKVRGIIDRVDETENGLTVVDYKTASAGVVRLQVPLYMDFIGAENGYYLSLKDFSRRNIDVDDIEPALVMTQNLISNIKSGEIEKKPIHKSVCEYCVMGSLCGGEK